ncbi:hypothetical protein NDN01_14305 [Sphingomonas sp. QA11]|uniref:hypothetical protein n=1 Tax=Sphingomonas sp. QA11 TaxID=2950605 RepID=UPI00234A5CE6|nr:hypothetical protein [Sphingomonas sp. QA11]WCM25240.1 hypothetical protein NDN01_14305 [Sphingomonas sp. QA11]
MNWWLPLTLALAWLVAGTFGLRQIRRSSESVWQGLFSATTTDPPPYDARRWQHRVIVGFSKSTGWLVIAGAAFLTLMSILVAIGVVPPASN